MNFKFLSRNSKLRTHPHFITMRLNNENADVPKLFYSFKETWGKFRIEVLK
jgi:hypothetical protein